MEIQPCLGFPIEVDTSTGCIGNRVYTDLGEDELYVADPGNDLARVADEVKNDRGG